MPVSCVRPVVGESTRRIMRMVELLMSVVVMLVMFSVANLACGRDPLREADERLHPKKAA